MKASYKTTYSRPESRKEGEALYAKVNPDRASTMTQQGTSGTRRSASQADQLRQNAGTSTSTSRRAGSTATETTRSSTQSGQTTGSSRRSSTGTQPATTGTQRTRSTSDPERERTTTGSGSNTGTEEGRPPLSTLQPAPVHLKVRAPAPAGDHPRLRSRNRPPPHRPDQGLNRPGPADPRLQHLLQAHAGATTPKLKRKQLSGREAAVLPNHGRQQD